ncbi:MAG TPA: hypothetical protein VK524_27470 [Polyangiaceae bacterium]|nr:hypothetical protein [Polyangiaceae bacterium]
MRSNSTLKLLLALAGIGSLLAVLALLVLAKPLLRYGIEQRARDHGVALELSDVSFGLGWVTFSNAKFQLIGVHEIGGTLRGVEVTLRGLEPERLDVNGAEVRVVGSLSNLALELSRWTSQHPETYRLPVTAKGMQVTWQSNMAEAAWLTLSDVSVVPAPNGRSLVAERAKVGEHELGKLGAAWTGQESLVSIGLGAPDLAAAPISVRITTGTPSKAQFRLAPTGLDTLSRAFGMKPLPGDIFAEGTLDLGLPPLGVAEKIRGSFAAQLKGFVPPHPPELAGFVFGDVTTFASDLEIAPDYAQALLRKSRVTAGAFALSGEGSLARAQDHVRVLLNLRGALPCGALAGAAITTRLGKTIGPLLARGAREFLSGTVGVSVKIEADTRDLEAARVERGVGIGCGLKPLKIPREIEELMKQPLPSLPTSFPPLPSSLPPLPPLPKLPTAFPPRGDNP